MLRCGGRRLRLLERRVRRHGERAGIHVFDRRHVQRAAFPPGQACVISQGSRHRQRVLVVVTGDERGYPRRALDDAEDRLGDDAECAFAADEQNR